MQFDDFLRTFVGKRKLMDIKQSAEMKRKDYRKPATLVVQLQQPHLMNGNSIAQSKTSSESVEDYYLEEEQTW